MSKVKKITNDPPVTIKQIAIFPISIHKDVIHCKVVALIGFAITIAAPRRAEVQNA